MHSVHNVNPVRLITKVLILRAYKWRETSNIYRLMTLAATRRCSESRYAEGSSIRYTSAGWRERKKKSTKKQNLNFFFFYLKVEILLMITSRVLINTKHTFPRQIVSATRCNSPPDKFWTWKEKKKQWTLKQNCCSLSTVYPEYDDFEHMKSVVKYSVSGSTQPQNYLQRDYKKKHEKGSFDSKDMEFFFNGKESSQRIVCFSR